MLLELSSNKDIFIKLLKLFGLLDLLNLSMSSNGLCEFITKTNELWVRHIFTFIIDNGLEIKAVGDVNRLDIMAFTLNNLLRLNFLTGPWGVMERPTDLRVIRIS